MWHRTLLTCFEKHDLVVLAEVHEGLHSLGELHHVLDSFRDAAGATFPHLLHSLMGGREREREDDDEEVWVDCEKTEGSKDSEERALKTFPSWVMKCL